MPEYRMRTVRLSYILALALSLMANATTATAKPLQIVASFSVLADVVREVGGDHVRVKSLVPPNGDPHSFEPSPDDAANLRDADLTFLSGEGLERWFERLAVASGYQGKPIVVSTGIRLRQRERKGQLSDDPHVWNSPLNVEIWVENIENALRSADPADAADYKARADHYTNELKQLDADAHGLFDPIPPEKRKILTSHDAFGYLARDYHIEFMAPLGFSTESEASAADVAKLIDQVRSEHVRVYFTETSNDPRLVQQIAAATGALPGGKLYAEALSSPDGPAPTYLRMFRHNMNELAHAMTASE
jgi:zinc/manganese transport system substrate-binding protein